MFGPILVTGATGTVGTEVVKQLAKHGFKVRAGCHTSEKGEKIKSDNVELVNLDFSKPETFALALGGVEKVFLLMPVSDKMVEMTSQFLSAAKSAGVKHIVKLSAFGADHDVNSTIIRWHSGTEKLLQESGIPYTSVRPNFFMQNFLTMYGDTIRSDPSAIYAPCGQGKVSFIDARDIAAFVVKCLESRGHENKSYNITGLEALTFTDVADVFTETYNKMVTYLDVTEEGGERDPQKRKAGARNQMLESGLPEWLVNSLMELYAMIKQNQLSTVTNTFEEVVGRKPISFRQFVEDNKENFKSTAPKLKASERLEKIREEEKQKEAEEKKKSRTGDETRTDYDVAYEHDRKEKKTFKLKIVYNRKGCDASGHCILSDPYNWKLDDEAKAILIDGKETAPGIFVKEIETEEPWLIINAANTCTPRVIAVIDMDTGKRIAP